MAYRIQSNALLTYSDPDYMKAVNAQYMYNFPITLNIGGKKYIIGAGTSDDVTIFRDTNPYSRNWIYILTTNRRLEYTGLESIDMDKWCHYRGIFFDQGSISNLQQEDAFPENYFDLSTRKQLKLLLQYDY